MYEVYLDLPNFCHTKLPSLGWLDATAFTDWHRWRIGWCSHSTPSLPSHHGPDQTRSVRTLRRSSATRPCSAAWSVARSASVPRAPTQRQGWSTDGDGTRHHVARGSDVGRGDRPGEKSPGGGGFVRAPARTWGLETCGDQWETRPITQRLIEKYTSP